mmetsp:Transcript_84297/g.103288  ORF Transcript_84297/g.103288 Transcript_84297/m.103288 type:complete len:106 (-) Transcript_84297:751-1068(-)
MGIGRPRPTAAGPEGTAMGAAPGAGAGVAGNAGVAGLAAVVGGRARTELCSPNPVLAIFPPAVRALEACTSCRKTRQFFCSQGCFRTSVNGLRCWGDLCKKPARK